MTLVSIAVNNRRKDKDSGEWKDHPTFIDAKAFGKTGEVMAKLSKGTSVFVEGKLEQEEWTDKSSGAKRSKLVVIVENMQFLEQRPAQPMVARDAARRGRGSDYDSPPEYDHTSTSDDIPF